MLEKRRTELKKHIRIASKIIGNQILLSNLHNKKGIINLSKKNTKQDYLKQLTIYYSNAYNLPQLNISANFSKLKGKKAGQIALINGIWYLDVDEEYSSDKLRTAAIVAHEMAHLVINIRGVRLWNPFEIEEITDTIVILAGFGKLIYSAYTEEFINPIFLLLGVLMVKEKQLGNLSRSDIIYISRIKKLIVKEKSIKRLSPVDVSISNYIFCYACGVKLYLQKQEGTFIIRCPICYMRQSITHKHAKSNIPFLLKIFEKYLVCKLLNICDHIRGFDRY